MRLPANSSKRGPSLLLTDLRGTRVSWQYTQPDTGQDRGTKETEVGRGRPRVLREKGGPPVTLPLMGTKRKQKERASGSILRSLTPMNTWANRRGYRGVTKSDRPSYPKEKKSDSNVRNSPSKKRSDSEGRVQSRVRVRVHLRINPPGSSKPV